MCSHLTPGEVSAMLLLQPLLRKQRPSMVNFAIDRVSSEWPVTPLGPDSTEKALAGYANVSRLVPLGGGQLPSLRIW